MSPGFSYSANRRDPGRVQALSAKCSSKYIRIRRKKARTLRPQTRLAMPKLSLATNKTLGLRNNSRDLTKNQHEARITASVPDAAELALGCIKSAITNTRIAVSKLPDISSQTSGLFSDAELPSRQAASAIRNSAGGQKNWPRHPTPDTRLSFHFGDGFYRTAGLHFQFALAPGYRRYVDTKKQCPGLLWCMFNTTAD